MQEPFKRILLLYILLYTIDFIKYINYNSSLGRALRNIQNTSLPLNHTQFMAGSAIADRINAWSPWLSEPA